MKDVATLIAIIHKIFSEMEDSYKITNEKVNEIEVSEEIINDALQDIEKLLRAKLKNGKCSIFF